MQRIKKFNSIYIKLLILIFLLILPWTFSASETLQAEKITSDLSFYEINTCNVTFTNFILNNSNTIYQNHYKFETNNYSSIGCYGKITGITQIGDEFSISVGTNSFVNLIIQGLFWIVTFWIIKKPDKHYSPKNFLNICSILFTCFIICYLISTEARYYEKTLYFLNLDSKRAYLPIFLILIFLTTNLMDVLNKRFFTLLHFLPITFLFIGAFSGFNLNIYLIPLTYYGFIAIFEGKINSKILVLLSLLIFSWSINGIGGNFYLKPDKIRGFTSAFYNYDSVLAWSILFFLSVFGLYYLVISTKDNLNFSTFRNNFLYTTIPLLTVGLIGANSPGINFFSLYYFGQQKVTTTQINPFAFNEWNEKLAWRGFSSSAETAGEFYGIALLFCIFTMLYKRKLDFFNLSFLIISTIGLYFSNNRASFLMCVFGVIIFLNSRLEISKSMKYGMIFITLIGAIIFIGIDNFTYIYSYFSVSIQANNYSFQDINSSFVYLLNDKFMEAKFFTIIFAVFSFVGFIFNRSELWGIFFSRYNPNFFEYWFGSGPLNFGQFYGETQIRETSSFLMPHSSYLSMLVFFGLFGTLFSLIYLLVRAFILRKHIDVFGFVMLFFIFINLIKSDSLNYINSLMLYLFIIFITLQKKGTFFKLKALV